MPTLIRIPEAGETVRTVKLSRWYVAEGDRVEAGAPLFEIEMSKASVDIATERSGRLAAQLAPVGSIIDVEAFVAAVAFDGEDLAAVRSAAIANHSPAFHPVPPRKGLLARLFGPRA